MLIRFNGGGEVCNAYEAALYDTSADLIMIQNGLGTIATSRLSEVALLDEPEERTAGLKDVLYNELDGLEEAEDLIQKWASAAELPLDMVVLPALEAPVAKRKNSTPTHFDNATVSSGFMHGPFAISIGTSGHRLFKSLRFPRRLSNEEILGVQPSPLDSFESKWTHQGRFCADNIVTTRQLPGDIVLIPAAPHPALHGVEVRAGVEAASVISSYIMTNGGLTAPERLRQHALELRRMELKLALGRLIRLRGRTVSVLTEN